MTVLTILYFLVIIWVDAIISACYVRSFAVANSSPRLARHYRFIAGRLLALDFEKSSIRFWLLAAFAMLAPSFVFCLYLYPKSMLWLPMLAVMGVIALVDFACELIPDSMTIILAPCFWLFLGFPEWYPAILSCVIFFLFWRFGLAMGDYKLLCAISLGAGGFAAMILTVIAFFLYLVCGKLIKSEVPFGPFASLTCVPALFLANYIGV